jgi:hypothetical protein
MGVDAHLQQVQRLVRPADIVPQEFANIPFEVFLEASGYTDDTGTFRLEEAPEVCIDLYCDISLLARTTSVELDEGSPGGLMANSSRLFCQLTLLTMLSYPSLVIAS